MSTGNISLDILLEKIRIDGITGSSDSIQDIQSRYPSLNEKESREIHAMIKSACAQQTDQTALVVTAPPSFSIKTRATKDVVEAMINSAKRSIFITGYSLSDYFDDLTNSIVKKSQQGVFVKFFFNNIDNQTHVDKLIRNKGRFLKLYNYVNNQDQMAALHAKVIVVDQETVLITSANLSYHGQEGNIELGTYMESNSIAKQIDELFTMLIFQKVFSEVD